MMSQITIMHTAQLNAAHLHLHYLYRSDFIIPMLHSIQVLPISTKNLAAGNAAAAQPMFTLPGN